MATLQLQSNFCLFSPSVYKVHALYLSTLLLLCLNVFNKKPYCSLYFSSIIYFLRLWFWKYLWPTYSWRCSGLISSSASWTLPLWGPQRFHTGACCQARSHHSHPAAMREAGCCFQSHHFRKNIPPGSPFTSAAWFVISPLNTFRVHFPWKAAQLFQGQSKPLRYVFPESR